MTTVVGYRRSGTDELTALGGTGAQSPAEVASSSDVLLSILPDLAALREVLLGPHGTMTKLRPGTVHVGMSTIDVKEKASLRDRVRSSGGDLLDCPIGGTPAMVRPRAATTFVSGEEASVDAVREVPRRRSGSAAARSSGSGTGRPHPGPSRPSTTSSSRSRTRPRRWSADLAEPAARSLPTGEALLLRGNGALTLGATPGVAVARMWLLSAACDTYLATQAAGQVKPLTVEEIASWRAVRDELLPGRGGTYDDRHDGDPPCSVTMVHVRNNTRSRTAPTRPTATGPARGPDGPRDGGCWEITPRRRGLVAVPIVAA